MAEIPLQSHSMQQAVRRRTAMVGLQLRSTQPSIPPGSLNRVPASAGVKAGVTSAEWQVTLCDLIWHVISRSGVVISITNCYIRFTLTYFTWSVCNKGITQFLPAIHAQFVPTMGLCYYSREIIFCKN